MKRMRRRKSSSKSEKKERGKLFTASTHNNSTLNAAT